LATIQKVSIDINKHGSLALFSLYNTEEFPSVRQTGKKRNPERVVFGQSLKAYIEKRVMALNKRMVIFD